jgi:hypothetical protein
MHTEYMHMQYSNQEEASGLLAPMQPWAGLRPSRLQASYCTFLAVAFGAWIENGAVQTKYICSVSRLTIWVVGAPQLSPLSVCVIVYSRVCTEVEYGVY